MNNLEKSRFILGISEGASPSEIKRAFRSKVKTWHPDLFHHDPRLRRIAEEKIKEINDARRILFFFAEIGEATHQKVQTPTENPTFRRHPGRRPASPGHSTLVRCPICGQMNAISQRVVSRLFLCYNCRNPLRESTNRRIRLLESPAKAFRIGKKVIFLPTIDYIKFLAFCACTLGMFILAGIGTIILLWAGSDILGLLFKRYFL